MNGHNLRGELPDVDSVWRFVFAGNATITLVSKATGTRFTYKVQCNEDTADLNPRPFWVKVLTGSNNEEDYRFLGTLWHGGRHVQYNHSSKSGISWDAPSAKAIQWFGHALTKGNLLGGCHVWHEGRCGRCGRTLTVPESVASGFGPECIQHVPGGRHAPVQRNLPLSVQPDARTREEGGQRPVRRGKRRGDGYHPDVNRLE